MIQADRSRAASGIQWNFRKGKEVTNLRNLPKDSCLKRFTWPFFPLVCLTSYQQRLAGACAVPGIQLHGPLVQPWPTGFRPSRRGWPAEGGSRNTIPPNSQPGCKLPHVPPPEISHLTFRLQENGQSNRLQLPRLLTVFPGTTPNAVKIVRAACITGYVMLGTLLGHLAP